MREYGIIEEHISKTILQAPRARGWTIQPSVALSKKGSRHNLNTRYGLVQ